MEYYVRIFRKTGSGITFIIQRIEEIASHPIGPAILSNTATKFILQQRENLKPIEEILKFNEKELSLVAGLRSQKKSVQRLLWCKGRIRLNWTLFFRKEVLDGYQ